MDKSITDRLCAYHKAVSDPNRLKLMKIFGSHDPNTLNVSDVAKVLGISQPAVTKHLKVMERVGLLSRERKGTSVYYAVNEEVLDGYLDDMATFRRKLTDPCDYSYDCANCPQFNICE